MEPRIHACISRLSCLFEQKVVYRERFFYLIRLENLEISETGFQATAIPLLDITAHSNQIERCKPPSGPWTFGSTWDFVNLDAVIGRFSAPYAGWTIWTEPSLVQRTEALARAGVFIVSPFDEFFAKIGTQR
jgi:hypothetical protein